MVLLEPRRELAVQVSDSYLETCCVPRSFLLDRRTWPGQAAQRRMLDSDPLDIGGFDLSTFLSAPVSASETSTIGKPMKGATEYIETVGEGPVRTEKRALVCRLKIVYNAACL